MNTQTTYDNQMVERYFSFIRNWDNEAKKDLIVKLTKSIDSGKSKKRDFSSCFGAWDDSRSADEIIDGIRKDRKNNREIEEF